MKIRAYQSEDLPCLLNAWEKASRLAHPFMNDDFFEQERKNIPELYIPNTNTWVMISLSKNVKTFQSYIFRIPIHG